MCLQVDSFFLINSLIQQICIFLITTDFLYIIKNIQILF